MASDGLCACGCGSVTNVAKRTYTYGGKTVRKGEHYPYITNHHRRSSPIEWVAEDTGYGTPCWLWQRAKSHDGYALGRSVDGRLRYVHLVDFEERFGPRPDGMVLDHLCRVRHCVNPDHLEAVTNAENLRRGSQGALKTHCKHGHPWIEENIYTAPETGRRSCKICRRLRRYT